MNTFTHQSAPYRTRHDLVVGPHHDSKAFILALITCPCDTRGPVPALVFPPDSPSFATRADSPHCRVGDAVCRARDAFVAGLPAVLLLTRQGRAQDAAHVQQHVKINLSHDGLDGPKVLVAMLFRMIDNGSYSAVSKLSKVLFDEAQRRRMQVPAMLYMAS